MRFPLTPFDPIRSRRLWRGWEVALCAPLAAGMVGCAGSGNETESPARFVTVETAELRPAVDTLSLLGDVEGEVDVAVTAQLPEQIVAVHVAEGDQVEIGDPLVTLEPDLIAGELRQASAALAAAEAARDRLQSDLARVRTLAAGGASPQAQVDQLTTELQGAEAQVRQLRAARGLAGSRRNRSVVRAPVAGMIADLTAVAGEQPPLQLPLCRIVQVERLKVEVHPVERDVVRIARDMAVRVAPLADVDAAVDGAIVRVSPVVDPLSRTGMVEVAFEGDPQTLRPGMAARVSIELRRRSEVLMVPAEALLVTDETLDEKTGTVFVHRNGRAVSVPVVLGERYGAWLEVRAGNAGVDSGDPAETENGSPPADPSNGPTLRAGDEVVVEGTTWLRDGAPVRVRSS